jgi:glutathione S-transferase
MSEFVVHGVPGSPFLRSVLLALEEKHAPYRIQPIGPGESKSEAYLKLHAFGRIPAVQHGDFNLYETQAILRYIDDVFEGPRLQPADTRAAARMNQIIGINDWYLFPKVVATIAFQRIVGPVLMGLTPNEEAIAAAIPDARVCFGELNRLLGDKPFLAGDQLSIADLMVAPPLSYLALTPEGAALLEGTALKAWLDRMEARPSMLATLPPPQLRKAA